MSDLYAVKEEDVKLKKFVNNAYQPAVIYKVFTRNNKIIARGYSPVWGDLFIRLSEPLREAEEDVRRGDIVIVTHAYVNDEDKESIIITENKT